MKIIILALLILSTACSQKKQPIYNAPSLSPLSADEEERIDLKLTQTLTLCSYFGKDLFLYTAIEKDMYQISKSISRFHLMDEMGLVSESEIIDYLTSLETLSFIDTSTITNQKIDEWASLVRQTEKSFTHNYDLSQCRMKIEKEITNNNLATVLKSALRTNLEAEDERQKYLPKAQEIITRRLKSSLLEARILILKIQEAESLSDADVDLLYDAILSLDGKVQSYVNIMGLDIKDDYEFLKSIASKENKEYYNILSPEWSRLRLLTYRRTLELIEQLFTRIKHNDP